MGILGTLLTFFLSFVSAFWMVFCVVEMVMVDFLPEVVVTEEEVLQKDRVQGGL